MIRVFVVVLAIAIPVYASENSVQLARGIEVSGTDLSASQIDVPAIVRDSKSADLIVAAFRVDANGPSPIRLRIPSNAKDFDVYRCAADGLYLRIEAPAQAKTGGTTILLPCPGEYVVSRAGTSLDHGGTKILFAPQVLSEDPGAKSKWKLTRTAARDVNGPIPLILVHGLSSDNWASFVAWASESDDAAALRAHFQLWKFLSPNEGVNAAVGYSNAYPGFDESLASYLNRFMLSAEQDGSVGTDGATYIFPEGPFCMLTHSQGGVTARAFLANFPGMAERCLGVVTLSGPHMGSPGATPEWVRQTLSRLGPFQAQAFPEPLRGAFAGFLLGSYLSTQRQSDLDMGWANYDAQGIGGIPVRRFRAWVTKHGFEWRVLSPRDANRTGARALAGYDDDTFEPAQLLDNFCGGMDKITPGRRGEMNMDKFFLYGAYLEPGDNWSELRDQAEHAYGGGNTGFLYDVLLRMLGMLMAQVESNGATAPLGTYLLSDGFVPLQSQLMLDGVERRPIYKTREVHGWTIPVRPFKPRMKLIRRHTLAKPGRLRVLPGWSHYDTVTGRYDPVTKTSPLFPMVANDLLSVIPDSA